MKIAIIGSGAVGGYFGAKLEYAGLDVRFLARGAQLKAMQARGLSVKSFLGDFQVAPLHATDRIEELGVSDLVLVAVKSWHVADLAPMLKPILHKNTCIIPLQNGVMARQELCEVLNPGQVLGGSCRIFCKITQPGHIQHFSVEPTIHFGEWDHSMSQRIQKLSQLFTQAGIKNNPSSEIRVELWKKFIIICTSALLADRRCSYGELLETPEGRQITMDLMREVWEVAQKKGVNVEQEYLNKSLEFMDSFAYDATASLARDIWAGKTSELDYQNGSVVKLAEELGTDVPINIALYERLRDGGR